MSEKTKKTKVQSVEKAFEILILGPNKQKHNSKRRCKKSKAKIGSEVFDSESSKVDEVVNYLCSAISNDESETSLNFAPLKMTNESGGKTGDCSGQKCYLNSAHDFSNQTPSTSSSDFNTLFRNLQVHAEKIPVASDLLNLGNVKKNGCDFFTLEGLQRFEFEKLKKRCYLNGQNSDASKELYEELCNLTLLPEKPEKPFSAQCKTNPTHFPSPETGKSQHSTKKNHVKSKQLEGCFSADKLLSSNVNCTTAVTHSPKLFSDKLEETLEKRFLREGNDDKKKNKNFKTDVGSSSEVETLNGSKKVVSNLEISKDSSESPNLKSEANKKGKKQQIQKVTEGDLKYPKHLSPGELKSLSDFGVLMSGIIRINPKNYKKAYVASPDKGMDILIEGLKDRNRALDGDEVYFILKAKEHHRATCDSTDLQKTAVVVGIKTLNHDRGAVGTLHVIRNKNNSFVLFSPRDSKLPRLRIQRHNWPIGFLENSESFKDRLFFAKILQWNDMRYAEGKLIKEIGETGKLEVETEAILLKQGLKVSPYDESLKKFLPPSTFDIMNTDTANREDFRKDCIFTIDPELATDLDDALSCKRLPNGNYEVGVHIADVSYFLHEGTPLDAAVAERAVTVYLVQKTYHMLPAELCHLCSLSPGEDKLCFSIIWEITPECKIVSHRFTRSFINSCAQFTYDQIQSIIDNVEDIIYPKIYGNHSPENIKEIIFFLLKVAVFLRNKRFKNGALKIDKKKVNFLLDKNQLPVDYKEQVDKPSNHLVEEFMLLANITVAEKLSCCFPNLAFLRSHPPPLPYVLQRLQNTLEKYGIIMDISSSKSLHSSLSRYSCEDYESLARTLVLQNALAKPMSRARYYCAGFFPDKEERRHYALCVPLYAHFTSPIRRYADVVVHRQMAAILKYADPPNYTSEKIQLIAENCNKKKYAAKLAEEMSVELYHNLYVGMKGSVICDAVVCDIKDKSFECIGLSSGLHQKLYFERIRGEVSQAKEDGMWRLTIKWPVDENNEAETIQIVEMFSIVRIELKRLNVLKIEATLLRSE